MISISSAKLGLSVSLLLLSAFFVSVSVPAIAQGAPSIAIVTAPTSAGAGQKVTIEWEVKGAGKISHTGVHWDTKAGNPADFKSYSKATPDFAAIDPPNDAPKKYSASIDVPSSGTVHYVVHAIVDGKDVYSPDGEKTIQIIVLPRIGGGVGGLGGVPGVRQPQQQQQAGGANPAANLPGPDPAVVAIIGGIFVIAVVALVIRSRRNKGGI
ncbi:MAG: hypothetical protein FJ358_05220 [Thaumarchaeota archaeon]|nr:hypothetical protein [Nitrososphaerota archaeon]